MISLDVKSEAKSASPSPLSLSTPSGDEPTVSFSELLKGVGSKKDAKSVQNGVLMLALENDEKGVVNTKDAKGTSKTNSLLSLLKSEEIIEKEESVELHPRLTQNLSPKEIKVLVKEAKDYLKQKIEASDEYKQSQIKELPKTLKGLAQVAKKLDIDVTKITVEELGIKSKAPEFKNIISPKEIVVAKDVKQETSHVKDLLSSKEIRVDVKTEVKTDDKHELKDVKVQLKPDEKVEAKVVEKTVKIDEKVEVKASTKVDEKIVETDEKVEVKTSTKADEKVEVKVATKANEKVEVKADTKPLERAQQTQIREEVKEKVSLISREIKETPLFKARVVEQHTTTEQIVQVKTSVNTQVEQKTPKDKADETLKLLLRGEKPSVSTNLTADFSVATAKVIAPSATTEVSKSIESLLHGEQSESHTTTKAETITTHKTNDFEVKLNEAKQMIKFLSADVKTAIEDYKSPFTRVKVQLNPQKLGEVDLTVIQRGKNLHVNISSNNTAINTLAMNANDLKVQLSNNGINNASLNFNNSSQNGENAQQGQQNRQQEQKEAHEEYNFFENEEANEEILSSLEIIVPQYG